MKQWINKAASTIFLFTLAIYGLIWLTVSYVGVKVTYVAGPVLFLSGLTAWWSSAGGDPSGKKHGR